MTGLEDEPYTDINEDSAADQQIVDTLTGESITRFPTSILQALLHYGRAGVSIFPLHPTEKKALIRRWQARTTTDREQHRRC
jgi:hypothetical protein